MDHILNYELCSTVCMDCILLIHSSVCGHWLPSALKPLWLTLLWTPVDKHLFETLISIFLVIHKSGIAELYGKSIFFFNFFKNFHTVFHGFPGSFSGKESTCQCRRHGFNPCFGKIPWRRTWPTAPVFLPGESHGQRSLEGYSPWGHRVRHDLATKQQQQVRIGCKLLQWAG